MAVSVSIVVPVYSGERYLAQLASELRAIREDWESRSAPLTLIELVFVDDNAIDRSADIIDDLSRRMPWIKAVHLSRNFGQHPATIAGILETSGDWVVTMDEDLQHPPSRITDLLRLATETHADVVYGKPDSAVHEAVGRDFTSQAYKRLVEWLTGNPHIRSANSFRLIRGPVARGASMAATHDVYFDVALYWFTQRIRTLTMPLKDTRFITTGKSGYRLHSLLSHARRLLVSSQLKVLRIGALFGLSITLSSLLLGIVLLLLRILRPSSIDAPGWTSIMLTMTFFSGITVFMTGIVLEYLSIMLARSNGRPLFFKMDRQMDADVNSFINAKT